MLMADMMLSSIIIIWFCPCFTGHSGGCGLSCNGLAGRAHLQPRVRVIVVVVLDPASDQSQNGLGIWQRRDVDAVALERLLECL